MLSSLNIAFPDLLELHK